MTKINSIFIIDDDPITVFGIRKMLSAVTTCEKISTYINGKLAIDAIKQLLEENQELPEVIFLDINMPIMDGWQFLEEFITLPVHKKIRINIVTSSIDAYDKENWELYQMKTDHLITFNNKPIQRKDIEAITVAA